MTLREIPSNCGNLPNSALHIRCLPMQDSWRMTGKPEVIDSQFLVWRHTGAGCFYGPQGHLAARIRPMSLLNSGLMSRSAGRQVGRVGDDRRAFWYTHKRNSGCTPSAEREDP